ncbi:HAMP domain-containing sensor histidine kinase [Dyadobacter sp. 3J3]|uniref:sensor histidine kinase n=1 Tax=Dyadobacter sp. 3J3 TaxID=2606600 RepID=UPI00135A949D|nr:ATP-binding protein [Dyadobacter sp. 3J3]
MNRSFKNKIAFNFTLSTALMVAVIFFLIYYIVNLTVFSRLEKDINFEADKHFHEVGIKDGKPYFFDTSEWLEREHSMLELNPVFIQLVDLKGNILDKSPNLKTSILKPDFTKPENSYFKSVLLGQSIAQIQIGIKENKKSTGYLIVAVPIDESEMVLSNLEKVLLISYPIILVILFLITRIIAGRSIQPVITVIETASKITNENLSSRIPLPANKDELKKLVVTINDLMDRIENAVEREKQFTSDASHELRTPLAVIKGTLEVLIRKPRTSQEYIDKVNYCIREMDRINHLVDQLLLMARFESQKSALDWQEVDLTELTESILERQQTLILEKDLSVEFDVTVHDHVYSDPYMTDIIIENLISNAIKYSRDHGRLMIGISRDENNLIYTVNDDGIGIAADEIQHIQQSFYRAEPLQHPEIKGSGLGLSIVKRMCQLLGVSLSIKSQPGNGTTAALIFKI